MASTRPAGVPRLLGAAREARRSAARHEAIDGPVERGGVERPVLRLAEGAQAPDREPGAAVLAGAAEPRDQGADLPLAEVAVDVAAVGGTQAGVPVPAAPGHRADSAPHRV